MRFQKDTLAPRSPGRPRDESLTQRRRGEILDRAARIFAETGFRQTDLKVVAYSLGVAKGTLYNYFPSKEDLFFAAIDQGLDALSEVVAAGTAYPVHNLDPRHALRCKVEAVIGFFDSNRHIFELFLQERAEFRSFRGDRAAFERCRLIMGEPLSTVLLGILSTSNPGEVLATRAEQIIDMLAPGQKDDENLVQVRKLAWK